MLRKICVSFKAEKEPQAIFWHCPERQESHVTLRTSEEPHSCAWAGFEDEEANTRTHLPSSIWGPWELTREGEEKEQEKLLPQRLWTVAEHQAHEPR